MKYAFKHINYVFIFSLLTFLSFGLFYRISAQSIATSTDDILIKIEERNIIIKHLEEDIKQYNQEVDNASKQAVTLKNTLKTLDITKKKIGADINLTENKINKTVLTIGQLDKEIDNIRETQNLIRNKSKELIALKTDMETKQASLKGQKKSLVNLKQDLNGKKQVVLYTTKEKETLLAQTKNKEETFKQLVKTTEEKKAQFEREVYEYESQLNIAVDKSRYPAPKHAILSWPLDNVFVTQKFGKTVGAEKLYASGTHNGIDFRASTGTKVKNVLDGVVVGTGNTDLYPGCYSFGKWVMVRHDNGLSTIYGHLSVISVSQGNRLETADLIGYSGNTGYSTGPHLHISVYATQGVRIEKYVNSRGCKQVTMPLADIKAYLDPLAYFPN